MIQRSGQDRSVLFIRIILLGIGVYMFFGIYVFLSPQVNSPQKDRTDRIPIERKSGAAESITIQPASNVPIMKRVLIYTVATKHKWYRDLVKANRENYCKKHGYYNLFVENTSVPLEEGLAKMWPKISEGLKLFNDSAPYDWIFMADLDLFIMNLNQTVENVIEGAIYSRFEKENKLANVTIDSVREKTHMIVAKDLNGYNTGSVMIRNSHYARYMFEEIWKNRHNTNVRNLQVWAENAVFIYLVERNPEFASHVTEGTQSAMNSYSRAEGIWYQYKPGEFTVHFPGPFKKDISRYVKILVELQPELKPINDARLEECKRINRTICDKNYNK
jgi:hypothetical protein